MGEALPSGCGHLRLTPGAANQGVPTRPPFCSRVALAASLGSRAFNELKSAAPLGRLRAKTASPRWRTSVMESCAKDTSARCASLGTRHSKPVRTLVVLLTVSTPKRGIFSLLPQRHFARVCSCRGGKRFRCLMKWSMAAMVLAPASEAIGLLKKAAAAAIGCADHLTWSAALLRHRLEHATHAP